MITTIRGGKTGEFEVNDGNTITKYPYLAKQATTKILGLNISTHSFTARHVKACVEKANNLLFHMRCLRNLSTPSKMILVKAYIITTLTYPCIPLNTASLSCLYQLQTVQNKALRWALNISLRQMIPNREIHRRANILPINQVIHA